MAELEIACQVHGNIEKIVVPDTYLGVLFKGEVRCGDKEDARRLRVEINRGSVISVEMA